MSGYTKLFSSIIGSTIWREPNEIRLVWITMLALADKRGEVHSSLPGLADFARVSIEECEQALEILKSPDKYSRTKDFDGRRIEEIDGGWVLLNHPKYRAMMSAEERREYFRVKKQEQRERDKADASNKRQKRSKTIKDMSGTVFESPACPHIAEAKAEGSTPPKPPSGKDNRPTTPNAIAVANLFNRRLETSWSAREIKAFKAVASLRSLEGEEELKTIADYYRFERSKGEEGRHRRDLLTFLNNYTGELDRARAWQEKNKPDEDDLPLTPAPPLKGLEEWLIDNYPQLAGSTFDQLSPAIQAICRKELQ